MATVPDFQTEVCNELGEVASRVVKWFGYKLHLLVDAPYELVLS